MTIRTGVQGEITAGQVIESGTVVVQGDAEIRFTIIPEINVIFAFSNDGQSGARTISNMLDPQTLRLNLINFNGSASNSAPWRIGTLRGRDLFVNYACDYIGDAARHTRVFSYTFFVRDGIRPPVAQASVHS